METFTEDLSRWLHDAFDLRQRSDYAIEVKITTEKAKEIFDHASSFLSEVKAALIKLLESQDI